MQKLLIIVLSLTLAWIFSIKAINAQDSSTGEGEILNKIKQKVESVRKNPKASIGTITDKTKDSIQIKNLEGKIDSVTITEQTSFKRTNNDSEIKFTDVAIGDYVAALGQSNTNNVLDAKKLLIVPPLSEPNRKTIFGSIVIINKKELVISEGTAETTYLSDS